MWQNIRFANGQHASVAAKGNFSVYRPTLSDFNNFPTIIGFFWDGLTLSADMKWNVKIRSKYSGVVGATQLINSTAFLYNTDGKWYLDGSTSIYDADGGHAYDPNQENTQIVELLDTPSAPATPCCTLEAQFNDYIRFKPGGSGSIWVTLGLVDWNMDGEACLVSGVSTTNLPPAQLNDSDAEPDWDCVRPE